MSVDRINKILLSGLVLVLLGMGVVGVVYRDQILRTGEVVECTKYKAIDERLACGVIGKSEDSSIYSLLGKLEKKERSGDQWKLVLVMGNEGRKERLKAKVGMEEREGEVYYLKLESSDIFYGQVEADRGFEQAGELMDDLEEGQEIIIKTEASGWCSRMRLEGLESYLKQGKIGGRLIYNVLRAGCPLSVMQVNYYEGK